ncbi:hypothetical protein OROGR_005734 [Orobanche gracilis]
MGKNQSSAGRTNLASCTVATIFLIFILISAVAVYFTVFESKDPKISVNSVQIPAFSAANSTANFTLSQYITVHNPNHAVFTHYDSSLQLLHGGRQVGLMFIPAGKIGPGKSNYIAATFFVRAFPVMSVPGQSESLGPMGSGGVDGFWAGPSVELASILEMEGRVRVLHFFTRRVEVRAECMVAIGVSDGSVLGLHC